MPLAVSAATFLAVAAALFALLGPRRGITPAPGSAADNPDLSIHFQKAGEEMFDRTLSRADLPLAVGDKVQFHVKLPTPMYAYLYWVASDGEPKRVWPPANVALDAQQPVEALSSPPGADRQSRPNWWQIPETGGPQVYFLGVSPTKLGEKELGQFEAQTAFMRKLLPADELVAEFEFPERPGTYRTERTRPISHARRRSGDGRVAQNVRHGSFSLAAVVYCVPWLDRRNRALALELTCDDCLAANCYRRWSLGRLRFRRLPSPTRWTAL